MTSISSPAVLLSIVVLFLTLINVVQAAPQEPSSMPEMDAATCDQLADIPNAPMSVEACRALMRMGEDDPSTHRPGDDAMSCAQIFAELRTMQGEGVSDATAAQTDAVIQQGLALGTRQAAEHAANQATGMSLAAASSLLPNFAGAMVMAPHQAKEVALMKKWQAEGAHYRGQVSEQTTASTAGVAQLMDANPRLPRLSQLAIKKNCEPPGE